DPKFVETASRIVEQMEEAGVLTASQVKRVMAMVDEPQSSASSASQEASTGSQSVPEKGDGPAALQQPMQPAASSPDKEAVSATSAAPAGASATPEKVSGGSELSRLVETLSSPEKGKLSNAEVEKLIASVDSARGK